jgi:hypothetical protein
MAKRSLKKGFSGVYFQYASDGDLIGAERFEVEVVGGELVLGFTLRPVDSNQRDDEEHLHNGQKLLSMQILDDERLIADLRRFCKSRSSEVTRGMVLAIISRNKTLTFRVQHQEARKLSLIFHLSAEKPQ